MWLYRDATNSLAPCRCGSQTVTEFTCDRGDDVADRGAVAAATRWLPCMKSIVPLLAVFLAAAALAQPPAGAPAVGPGAASVPESTRSDLWQLLTPEQRDQLWRSLTPEQKSDVWRGLQPQERREMRERMPGGELRGLGSPWAMGRRPSERGERPSSPMMSAEERQQMREQIREAHRLRRERMEAERDRRPN